MYSDAFFQYGMSLRGVYYEDFATLRMRDITRVKSPKFIMAKSKLEFVLVRPGVANGSELEIKLLEIIALNKAKGF